MNILIIGSGGREHAIGWKVASSANVNQVYVAPGNAGTAMERKIHNVEIDVLEIDRLITFAKEKEIHLTIVGPEAPLAAGIVDQFQQADLKCFGPSQAAAQLESSKTFCKDFLVKYDIPTAKAASFCDLSAAIEYLQQQPMPIVIKADGLAAGKGVIIAHDQQHAIDTASDMLAANKFGAAGAKIVIEEFLVGEEASFIVMVDGEHVLALATSQDHKARDDGDKGPNTGGMGAYSPAPIITQALHQEIMQSIIEPTVKGMITEGTPYTGFLYAGLMITTGGPKVLEYNCRLGDPETQPIMLRLESDLAELCLAAVAGKLDHAQAKWSEHSALGVVLAAGGYPNSYNKGDNITGLDAAEDTGHKIFHAGTKLEQQQVVTNGGRVLCVTAMAEQLATAQQQAYDLVDKVNWPGMFYRGDIGDKAL